MSFHAPTIPPRIARSVGHVRSEVIDGYVTPTESRICAPV